MTNDIPRKTGIKNKGVSTLKDEAGGKQIEEFLGLRAKLYSYVMDGEDHKKCKDVKKYVENHNSGFLHSFMPDIGWLQELFIQYASGMCFVLSNWASWMTTNPRDITHLNKIISF